LEPRGQIAYHTSKLDSQLQPLALCASDDGSEPLPLIVELSPGSIADLPRSVRTCEQMVRWAAEGGERCVVIKPGQRGPGSVGQGPAEVDVLEAIEWACAHFPVDRDRISVTGSSMGGAATWYMASHYPDLFAAAAPFCGYCDYDLWTKPGGHIMRTQQWERFSWESRGAAYRIENLSNTALWIVHGQWDISIGGGVPVEHSRRMSQRLTELGIEHRFTEVPRCGHGCVTEETGPAVTQWLCRQQRDPCPQEVHLVAHGLRHNRSFYVRIGQFESYGRRARVHARIDGAALRVSTENVRRLTLGPVEALREVALHIDSTVIRGVNLSNRPVDFERTGDVWRPADAQPPGCKRHGVSGPIGDLFFAPHRFIYGTGGSDHEAFILAWLARHLPGYFRQCNGGVHRGVFAGESWHELPFVEDGKADEQDVEQCNLMLYGSAESNAVWRQYREHIPVEVGRSGVEIAGREFEGKNVGFTCVFPHPANAQRYLCVTGGNSPEALAGCSHLGLQLLPDYLVWQGAQTWWGFFDNDWR